MTQPVAVRTVACESLRTVAWLAVVVGSAC